MVVPPIEEWMSPIGTGEAGDSACSAAMSAKFLPKYQQMALNR
jgi:hypothetical protein